MLMGQLETSHRLNVTLHAVETDTASQSTAQSPVDRSNLFEQNVSLTQCWQIAVLFDFKSYHFLFCHHTECCNKWYRAFVTTTWWLPSADWHPSEANWPSKALNGLVQSIAISYSSLSSLSDVIILMFKLFIVNMQQFSKSWRWLSALIIFITLRTCHHHHPLCFVEHFSSRCSYCLDTNSSWTMIYEFCRDDVNSIDLLWCLVNIWTDYSIIWLRK